MGFIRMGGDSVVRMDERPLGTAYGDSSYWENHEGQNREAGFEVLSYNMELTVRSRLYAEVDITVSKNTESDDYCFTLYRDYKIVSVTDGDGNILEYSRDGDYLNVIYGYEGERGEICVTYQGTGNKYYSNYQGICLTGYFPWYPMAGYLELWDSDSGHLVVNVDEEEKDFQIHINTGLTIASNLQEISEDTYSGTAVAATLVGGLLTQVERDGYVYYDSPLNSWKIDFSELQDALEGAEELLGCSFGIDLGQTILICLPGTISRTDGGTINFVVFPDHILFGSEGVDLVYAAFDAILPEKEGSEELRDLFIDYLTVYVEGEAWSEYIEESSEAEEPEYDLMIPLIPDNAEDAFADNAEEEAYTAFEQLFCCRMKQYGAEAVFQSCYSYFISESMENQVDFLYDLSEEDFQ